MALKRSRSAEFPVYADEPDMHIIVAAQSQPLVAHYSVLRQFSTCVRDLPRISERGEPIVWDLQQLVLEGDSAPVSAEVVQRWLDLVYSRVDAARRVRRITDLDEARPLLSFADAIGASQVLIDDIGRRLADNPDLSFAVKAGEGQQQLTVKLALGSVHYIRGTDKALCSCGNPSAKVISEGQEFAPHAPAFPSAVCSALESWLHLAGRLGMVPLCRALLDFIKAQLIASAVSLVLPAYDRIFSRRVLECMPRELLYEALVRDGLTDRPAEVKVEAKGATVTFTSPVAAIWMAKAVGEAQSMDLEGRIMTAGFAQYVHTVMGGPAPGAAPGIVKGIMAKALQDTD